MIAPTLKRQPITVQREFQYTRELYHALGESGLFEGTKVELIRGRLIEMPPISDQHGTSSLRTAHVLRHVFPDSAFTVRPGLPFIAADNSEPEPDICVVRGSVMELSEHPRECLLLVEVSLSTLDFDRGEKASVYAEAGVADYWIVNLVDRVVEIHREPKQSAEGTWIYGQITTARSGETLSPLAAADASIRVDDLLP